MRQKGLDLFVRFLLVIVILTVSLGHGPVIRAAGWEYNGFDTPAELSDFTVSGEAQVYVSSGMLKVHTPAGAGNDVAFARPLEVPLNEGVMEARFLFGRAGNVKNLFLNSKGTPLVVLDNGNTTTAPSKTGILASTAQGLVQLRAPDESGSAYTAMQWHHVCTVIQGGRFDVYFDGAKLNAEPLSLPTGTVEAFQCGARTWDRETLLWDDFRVSPLENMELRDVDLIDLQTVKLTFSNPVREEGLGEISLSRDGGGVQISTLLQDDPHTVFVSVPAGLRKGVHYTLKVSGVSGLFGGMASDTADIYQPGQAEPANKFVDELDRLEVGKNNVWSFTKDSGGKPAFYFDTEPAENYCGDQTRIFLSSYPGPSEIVYTLPEGIDSFRIVTFEADRTAPAKYDLAAEVSQDADTFVSLNLQRSKCELIPKNTAFQMYEYTGRITAADMKYFKLILRRQEGDGSTSSAWTPKVARIELNCLPPAPARLISTYPGTGEALMPGGPVLLNYDQPLDAGTLADSITVDGMPVQAELSGDGRTVRLSSLPVSFGGEYTLKVLGTLRSVSGVACEQTVKTFRTPQVCGVEFLDPSGNPLSALPEKGEVTPVVQIKDGQTVFVSAALIKGETLSEIHTAEVTGTAALPPVHAEPGDILKVFFWDSLQSLRPVAEPVVLDRMGREENDAETGVLSDSFETLGRMFSYSGALRLETSSPAAFYNDESRLAADGEAALTYCLPRGLAAIKLLAYLPRDGGGGVRCSVSPDNLTYSDFSCETTEIDRPNTKTMMAYEAYDRIPEGTRYLRLQMTGEVQLGNLELFYGSYDLSQVQPLQEELGYQHFEDGVRVPTAAEMQAMVRSKTGGGHPRLMAAHADFDRVKANQEQSPYKNWLTAMKAYADRLGANGGYQPVPFVQTDIESEKKDFLTDIREIKKRVETLAMLWRVTGNTGYAQWCWQELESVCRFPTLYPEHFLNVGEGALSLAVGYDWLYDYLTPHQRQTLEDGIMRLAISPALPYMRSGSGFVNNTNNWNSVCVGGVGVAALCFADRRNDCAEAAAYAVRHCIRGFRALAPDGSYPEGPGYWDFGTAYAVYWLSALQTAAGEDFGLTGLAGLSQTGQFPLYLTSPIGKTFNFADGGDGRLNAPQSFWLAKQFDMPAYGWNQLSTTDPKAYDLLWYDPAYAKSPSEAGLELNHYLAGEEDIAVLRQNWSDPNALYVAFKGGDNQSSHGDLDIGTFLLDAMNVRWAEELGAGYYHSDGYWDFGRDAGRWNYYRKRAEGHNTLVLNPDTGPDQDVYAVAQITGVQRTGDGAYAQLDMTPAYSGSADSVLRRLTTFHGSTEVLIQDNIQCGQSVDLYWFFHTPADISLTEGDRTAVLTKNGKRMKVRIAQPAEAVFTAEEAKALAESPHPENDSGGHKKLSIHLPQCSGTEIAVVCTPIWDETYENTPLPDIAPIGSGQSKK